MAYLGCYVDSADRALPTSLLSANATVASCTQAATAQGMAYAGLQWSGQCWGGNALTTSKVSESECNMPCTANTSEVCGGNYRNSLYATGLPAQAPAPASAMTPSQRQIKKSFVSQDGTTVWYLEYLPATYADSSQTHPLLVFFHGSGETGPADGSGLEGVKTYGVPKLINANTDMCFDTPAGRQCFIVVSPQNSRAWWNVMDTAGMVAHAMKTYRVDPKRVYVTGLSMGGGASWELAAATVAGTPTTTYWAGRIAAVVPIAGASDSKSFASGICNGIVGQSLPVWAFHGTADPLVAPATSQNWVDKINRLTTLDGYTCAAAANPAAQLTMYPGVGHDSWSTTYDPAHQVTTGMNIYQWMLAHPRP